MKRASSSNKTILLKTQAVVLNIRPFSKTSQMVTWLSPELGRIVTPVKGACRGKSNFLGQYDFFYTCEIVIYAHERDGIHQIRECTPLKNREFLRSSWRGVATASYACDLIMRSVMPGQNSNEIFTVLNSFLDSLSVIATHYSIALLWFEVNALKTLGSLPDFSSCKKCPAQRNRLFSLDDGRFVCEHFPQRIPNLPSILLHAEIISFFNLLAENPLFEILEQAKKSNRRDVFGDPEPFPGIFGLRRFLGLFLSHHLDFPLNSRKTAFDLLIS